MPRDVPVLRVTDLTKTYRTGFRRKRVDAVRGISFEVKRGEIFGLLGPNGAGKTSTIKMLLRLIYPTSGSIEIFGHPPGTREAAERTGYMPENPYIYQYLTALEFLDLCGRLSGMKSDARGARARELIHTVGLDHASDRPIRNFSKGMMQRIGLAQSLLHDPELLILDEPMSGLDPIGRKEIRDVLVQQRERGKTLLFTSHILSDVETLCDRVVILQRGLVTSEGEVSDLLESEDQSMEVALCSVTPTVADQLRQLASRVVMERDDRLTLVVHGRAVAQQVARQAMAQGAQLRSLTPERKRLEQLFITPGNDDTSAAQ